MSPPMGVIAYPGGDPWDDIARAAGPYHNLPPLSLGVVRVQRQRTKGWRMPPNTVYCGRPTKWGNPYEVGSHTARRRAVPGYRFDIGNPYYHRGTTTRLEAAEAYRFDFLRDWSKLPMVRRELAAKNLACWCPLGEPCHCDLLLVVANAPTVRDRSTLDTHLARFTGSLVLGGSPLRPGGDTEVADPVPVPQRVPIETSPVHRRASAPRFSPEQEARRPLVRGRQA